MSANSPPLGWKSSIYVLFLLLAFGLMITGGLMWLKGLGDLATVLIVGGVLVLAGTSITVNLLEKQGADQALADANADVLTNERPVDAPKAAAEGEKSLPPVTKTETEPDEYASALKLSIRYSSQLRVYELAAGSRASWSFFWALVAMSAGLVLVGIAAWHILTADSWTTVAAGSVIAAVGGTMSTFLAQTFLEIHRVSLVQLATYFQQPVINDHIAMAEKLITRLGKDNRDEALRAVIGGLLTRISAPALIGAPGPKSVDPPKSTGTP